MGAAEKVRELVEPVVTAKGLDLFDVEHAGPTLRVLVDRPGGVHLDLLAELTRVISALLDEHDPMPGRYTLEVSSPGLERTLRRPEHFRWAEGQKVTVKTTAEVEGDRRVQGVVAAADDDAVEIAVDGGERRRLAYHEIDKARTVFEWGPTPKPTSKPPRKPKPTRKKATKQ
jgi:ribosome maturation factor RimP